MTTAIYDHKNKLMAVDCRIVTDGVIVGVTVFVGVGLGSNSLHPPIKVTFT